MRPIFSDTVDELAKAEPEDETLLELLRALRAALVVELKRRGVWRAPPSFLRVLGPSWMANDGEALAELTQDAYLYVFVQRLDTLMEGRRRGHDVGPLVLKIVRQFVSHRQRLADPVGYCVYSRLHEAVLQLVDSGRLHPMGGGRRIHNLTVLSFEAGSDVSPIDGERLAELVDGWNESLLPELITALGKAVIPLVDELGERVLSLRARGVDAFRFGALVTPLKRDVRRRWSAVWGKGSGELGLDDGEDGEGYGDPVPITWPRNPVEYESLLDCVHSSIDLHRPDGDRGSLWYLWLVARGIHRSGDEPRRVSVAGVAKLLEVSRRQVGKLLEALRGMVTACLSAFGSPDHRSTEPTHPSDDTASRAESAGR